MSRLEPGAFGRIGCPAEYDAATPTWLEFIRGGQGAGLILVKISTILEPRGCDPCVHVHDLFAAKLVDVSSVDMSAPLLEEELKSLITRSHRLDGRCQAV